MIDKTKEFLVLNYNSFPVVVNTKYQEYIIPAADGDNPSSLPMTWDEILTINNNTRAFKNGFLVFEENVKEELYKALRIVDWESILTNEQIKEIILRPSKDGVAKLIAVTDDAYFDRIRGVYTYLRNNGYDISNRIDAVILARYKELRNGKKTSAIVLEDKTVNAEADKIKELEAKLAQLEAALTAAQEVEKKADDPVVKTEEEKPKAPAKTKKTTSTGTKKTK